MKTLVISLLLWNVPAWAAVESQGLKPEFEKALKKDFDLNARNILAVTAKREQSLKQKDLGLSPNEKVALFAYTSRGYKTLNPALRSGKPLGPELNLVAATLKSAWSKLPVYKGVVARSTVLPPAVLAQYKENEIVSDRGYTSSTRKMEQPRAHHIVIQSLTGRAVGIYSAVPEESEVLFAPDTKFKVVKVTKVPMSQEIQFDLEEVPAKL